MSRRRLLGGVLALLGVVLLGGVAGAAVVPGPATPASWVAPVTVPSVAGGVPQRLRIPSIAVDTPLELLELGADGTLLAPADYTDAGWYDAGPAPGDPGPAVLAGHVDSRTGPAVFYRLRELRAGASVQVLRAGRWLDFRVVTTQRYPKDAFPAPQVYGPTPGPELRLITCGGTFDRAAHSYRDNVVVYAVAS